MVQRLGLSERAALAAAGGKRHPLALRSEILVRCEKQALSTPQLAELLGIELTLASYHVRTLVQAELLGVADSQMRSGAPLVFYRAAEGWGAAVDALNRVADTRPGA